jgi:PAS domain S-box-containing protein
MNKNQDGPAGAGPGPKEQTEGLVRELEVHQIELEIQNAELQESRARAETLLAQYTDLYDFAPTGYMTLDREETIRQVNLAGARLLGVDRSRLVQRHFGSFVAERDRRAFSEFLQTVFASQAKECCEVTLPQEGSQPLFVLIEGMRSVDGQICRMAVQDITERRRAEDAARVSARQVQALFEASVDVIGILGADGTFRDVSPSIRELLGYEVSEVVGRSGFDFVHPDDRAALQATFASRLAQPGDRTPAQFRLRGADGALVDVEATVNVLLDDPDVRGIVTTVRDITGRKQVEAALGESQARLMAFLDNSVVIAWLKDERGRYVNLSENYRRRFGVRLQDWVGKTDFEIWPREVAEVFRKNDEQVLAGNTPIEAEEETRQPDGSRAWWLTSKFCLRDSAGNKFVGGLGVDITERKKAEAEARASAAALRELNANLERLVTQRTGALRQSEEKYRELITGMTDGVFVVDVRGSLTFANPALARLLGYEHPGEVEGRSFVEFLAPEKLDEVAAYFRGAMGARQSRGAAVFEIIRRDGTQAVIEIISSARLEGGRAVGMEGVVRDITEKTRSEAVRARLEAQINAMQKMEALGTLAGGIAHDFNNILGAIIGNVELARQDIGPGHPAMESLAEIRKASYRARDLVQRILTFASRQQQPQNVIALRPVVEEVVALLRRTLPAGVELTTVCDADTPTVLADSTQIHQVLMNLCTNAWHALDGGLGRIDIRLDGVTLDAEAASADVSLRPGRFARLSVTDNGSGMDAATIEHVFEPFFTTKPVDQGTGLGLSVVHGIMKGHGGAVTVTSRPEAGTTFCLYFPAAEAPKPSAVSEGAAAELLPAPTSLHVLYLDDEAPLVLLARRLLKRVGHRVSGYTRAEEALAALRADPGQFDLVVTDLNMPGMSGLKVAREVVRLRPDLPVVLVSGYISEDLRARALEAGVRQLIYKPDMVEELCAVAQRLVGPARTP